MLTKIFQGVGTAGLSRFIEESDMKTPQKKNTILANGKWEWCR